MLETIVNIPFLKDLSQEQLDLLAPLFTLFTASPKAVIFEQGGEAEYLYLIVSGTVSIQYKPYDGPAIVLTRLRDGDVCGWSSVTGAEKYTSSAISVTALKTLRIRGASLRTFCMEHREIGASILEKLAEVVSPRWKNAKDQVRDMLQNKVGNKQASA